MKKLLLSALALSSLSLCACMSKDAEAADDATSQTEAPKANLVSFAITGMT